MLTDFNRPRGSTNAVVGILNGGTSIDNAIGYLTPEMFSNLVVDGDWSPAINQAITTAANMGINTVVGFGVYNIADTIICRPGVKVSPSGLNVRQGFRLTLNVIIVDATKWPQVPANFWDAKAAFSPLSGVEHLVLHVNEFDGGGRATCFDVKGGSLNTSTIHIGNMRNHVIGYRNYLTASSQSGMNKITGNLWQGGYHAVLIGGTSNGGGNAECHHIDINWCATHRYGGLSLQDRTQYTNIPGGTYDYNGKYTAVLTLDSLSSSGKYDVEYGDTLSIGTKTGIALSSIMTTGLNKVLVVTESGDKTDGVSDYTVGDTVTFGSWSATISAIDLCSTTNVRYHDIILSNRTGDFSKCTITPEYLGGIYCHNPFTNHIWCPNSVAVTSAMNYRGLSIAGDIDNSYWYATHLYGNTPFLTLTSADVKVGKTLTTQSQILQGNTYSANLAVGVETTVMTFVAGTASQPRKWVVDITSSVSAQCGSFEVYVNATGLVVKNQTNTNVNYTTDGLKLNLTLTGSAATIRLNAIRKM